MSECEDDSSGSLFSNSDVERDNAVFDAQQVLERSYNLRYIDSLGRGTYGDVLRMVDMKSKIQKAAKVVISNNTVDLEQSIWPKLFHENILHVEQLLQMPDKTMVFLTPIKFKALHDIILCKPFQESYSQNHKSLKYWLKDALTGIEYLHSNTFCHLDLKLDNILVGYDGRACVCDFSFINYHINPLSVCDIGLPEVYRPPEAFREESRKSMDGIAVDLWAYGIIILESYTDQFLLENVDECDSWVKDVRPILEAGLEDDTFYSLVQHTFPNYPFSKIELADLLEFIDIFLQLHPQNRIFARHALTHRFFEDILDFVVILNDIFPTTELSETFIGVSDENEVGEMKKDSPFQGKQYRGGYATKVLAGKRKTYFKTTKTKTFMKAKNRMHVSKGRKYRLRFRNGVFRGLSMKPGVLQEGKILKSENVGDTYKDIDKEIAYLITLMFENEEPKEEPKKERLREREKAKIASRPIVVTYLGVFRSRPKRLNMAENSRPLKNNDFLQPHESVVEDLGQQLTNNKVLKQIMTGEEVITENGGGLTENIKDGRTFYFWLNEKWNTFSKIVRRICFCARRKQQ